MAHRILRWSLRGAVGLLTFLVVTVVAVYLTAQTEWGRARVRRAVETVLAEAIDSEVTIGGLEGSLVGWVVLTDVTVKDRAGREAVHLDRLEASYTLLGLLEHTVHVQSLVVSDLVVRGRRDANGKLNLAELIPASPETGEPSPWRVIIDDARIETGSFYLDERLRAEGVAIRVSLQVDDARVTLAVAPSQGRLVERDLVVKASGTLHKDGPEVRLDAVLLEAGQSRLDIASLVTRMDGAGVEVRGAADLKARDLHRFLPELPWRADMVVAGTVRRSAATEPYHLDLAGTLAGAAWTLHAAAKLDRPAVELTLHTVALDPAAIWTGAPRGLLHVETSAVLAGSSLASLRGRVRVVARGALGGHRFDEAVVAATLDDGPLRATLTVLAAGDRLDADATVDLAATPILVREGRVRATLNSLPRLVGATGQVSADLSFRGPLDELSVGGTLHGRGLRYGPLRLAGVTADVHLRGVPAHPAGHATIMATGVSDGTTRVALARAVLTVDDLDARAGRLELTADDLRLEDLGSRLGLDGLSGRAGVRLVVAQRGRRTETLTVAIKARDVAYGVHVARSSVEIDASLHGAVLRVRGRGGVDGRVTGKIGLAADLRPPRDLLGPRAWDGRDPWLLLGGHAEVAGVLHGVGDRPLGIVTRVDVDGVHLNVVAAATREGGGRATLDARVAVRAPMGAASVERATLTVDDVELSWIDPLRQRLPGLHGVLSLKAVKGPAGVVTDLRVTGARVDGLRATVDVEVHATLNGHKTAATLAARVGGVVLLEGDLGLEAGLDALLAGDTADLLRAPIVADLRVPGFPLDRVRAAFAVGVAMSGAIDVHAGVTGSAARPIVSAGATLRDARIAGMAFDRFDVDGRFAPDRLEGTLTAAQQAGGSLRAHLEVDPRDVRTGKARIEADAFDLGFLAAFGPTGLHVEKGRLAADLQLDRAALREGWLKLTAAELRATEVLETFREADLDLAVDRDGSFKVAVHSRVGLKGRVELAGEGKLVGLALREASGTFRTSKLSVSTGRSRVGVDASGRFTGTPGDGYGLQVVLDQTSVNLPKDLGGSLHSTGTLEDVTYVDQRARDEQRTQPLRVDGPLLHIHLTTPAPVLVRSEQVRAYLSLDLNVSVHPSFSVISGPVRIERGYLELFGRRWSFQRSHVHFDGSLPPDPSLDITLGHDFRATSVAIHLAGTASKPEITLSSAGTYDRSQLLSFVLGGSPDESGPASERDLSQRALSSAGGFLFGQIQPLLRKLVPVDVLAVKQRTGTNQLETITVGKWLSKDIFVAYGHRFADPSADAKAQNSNEATLEWYLLHGMRFDLVVGDGGEGSADVLWIRRW